MISLVYNERFCALSASQQLFLFISAASRSLKCHSRKICLLWLVNSTWFNQLTISPWPKKRQLVEKWATPCETDMITTEYTFFVLTEKSSPHLQFPHHNTSTESTIWGNSYNLLQWRGLVNYKSSKPTVNCYEMFACLHYFACHVNFITILWKNE